MKRSKKKLQFKKESVKTLTNPQLGNAVGGRPVTTAVSCPDFADCFPSYDGFCTTGGLSCLVVCDLP
jgi:hypothetical protein